MKRISVALLILCLLLSIVGCNNGGEDAGKYICVQKMQGEEELDTNREWLLLNPNGKGSMDLGLELDLSWKQDGKNLTIETDFIENTYQATLQDDELLMDVDDIHYIFVKEGEEKAWRLKQEELQAALATEPVPVDAAAVGHYSCTSAIWGERTLPPEGKWLDLFDDGTAKAYFSMELPGEWSCKDGALTLILNNGEAFTGSLDGDTVSLIGETCYTMKRTGEAGTINEAMDLAIPTALVPGSSWSGTLKIRRHTGRGILRDGKYSVIGKILEIDGKHYFEVHYADEPDAAPIVHLQVGLHKSNLEPLLGNGYDAAWIFEDELEEAAAFTLTMFLDSENELEFYHEYKSWTETCDLYFSFNPDEGD